MLGALGGKGMTRNRGSASCSNIAAMGGGQPGAGSSFPPVGETPATGESVSAAGGAGGHEDRFSDLISRCRQQGMRMSISVARGIASKPMQQQ
jgi:hypothetical protein